MGCLEKTSSGGRTHELQVIEEAQNEVNMTSDLNQVKVSAKATGKGSFFKRVAKALKAAVQGKKVPNRDIKLSRAPEAGGSPSKQLQPEADGSPSHQLRPAHSLLQLSVWHAAQLEQENAQLTAAKEAAEQECTRLQQKLRGLAERVDRSRETAESEKCRAAVLERERDEALRRAAEAEARLAAVLAGRPESGSEGLQQREQRQGVAACGAEEGPASADVERSAVRQCGGAAAEVPSNSLDEANFASASAFTESSEHEFQAQPQHSDRQGEDGQACSLECHSHAKAAQSDEFQERQQHKVAAAGEQTCLPREHLIGTKSCKASVGSDGKENVAANGGTARVEVTAGRRSDGICENSKVVTVAWPPLAEAA